MARIPDSVADGNRVVPTIEMLRANGQRVNLADLLTTMVTNGIAADVNTDTLEAINNAIHVAVQAIQVTSLASAIDLAAIEIINTAIQGTSAAGAVDLAAIEVLNTAIQTAVQLIDNAVGAQGVDTATGLLVVGSKAEATVPTEIGDGLDVRQWLDTFGRIVSVATDLAQQANSIVDTAPAQMQVQIVTDWPALDATDEETPRRNVRDYENHTFGFIPSGLAAGESMEMIIWHSFDGTNWYPLETFTLDGDVAADIVPSSRYVSGFKTVYLKVELGTLVGTASVTPQMMNGN